MMLINSLLPPTQATGYIEIIGSSSSDDKLIDVGSEKFGDSGAYNQMLYHHTYL